MPPLLPCGLFNPSAGYPVEAAGNLTHCETFSNGNVIDLARLDRVQQHHLAAIGTNLADAGRLRRRLLSASSWTGVEVDIAAWLVCLCIGCRLWQLPWPGRTRPVTLVAGALRKRVLPPTWGVRSCACLPGPSDTVDRRGLNVAHQLECVSG